MQKINKEERNLKLMVCRLKGHRISSNEMDGGRICWTCLFSTPILGMNRLANIGKIPAAKASQNLSEMMLAIKKVDLEGPKIENKI